jgi:hypothetical protein
MPVNFVDLAIAWGTQTRNYCPDCQRFVRSGAVVTCSGCNTTYRQDPRTGLYLVVEPESVPS